MLFNEKSNPNLKKFEIYQNDFYSLDKASFYEITDPEIWDFSESETLRFEFVPFFIMRAILHKKLTNQAIQINHLNFQSKQNISKFGSSIPLQEFFSGVFFPTIVGNKSNDKLKFYEKFIENYNFYKEFVNDKYVICGGGVLKKSNTLLKPFISELFEKFELEKQKGKFYFRATKYSYFYPLDKKTEPQIFFVQERLAFSIPFHFFYIELEKQ